MYSIGLTGGIGSGKTRVADLLAEWGAAVIDTDDISRGLTAAGGGAMAAIVAGFGPVAADPSGALDRAWMRELVFRDPEARGRLEAILHPLITAATVRASEAAAGAPYQVFVVPLLVESGRWRERVDRICVVDCDPDTQVERVGRRSGLTPEAIRRIMAVQVPRATRLAAADDVIVNDGATTPLQLMERARALHDRWLELAGAKDRAVHVGQQAPRP
ncbi:dephospho-CoA kinase [Bordetella genomosp. 5]|uniref:Dephospho-CoA kinase n=1 Tax=Bordetella genomosp. 5 TaxID=1395608 RepID=A0A261U0R9_9BORD|nr:dephospho-CoA kinase [Bordetella genomosp. 5]OZI47536.1 dephospho-CoA kinase [Bordetella genomosp. 5]OZI55469.1 dephospho-CoA kinase [Bordetella genomosp. 5]